jgi:hypothetical protein
MLSIAGTSCSTPYMTCNRIALITTKVTRLTRKQVATGQQEALLKRHWLWAHAVTELCVAAAATSQLPLAAAP